MVAMFDFERMRREVAHDPCLERDRVPVGAVPIGTSVRVMLRVNWPERERVRSVRLLVEQRNGTQLEPTKIEVDLESMGEGFAGEVPLAVEPHVAFYTFELLLSDGDTAYYVPRVDGRTTAGELVQEPVGRGFQVTVYEPAFASPDWMVGAVMYQIFPDRFARSASGVFDDGLAYHEAMGRPVQLHDDWNEPVEWLGPEAVAGQVGECDADEPDEISEPCEVGESVDSGEAEGEADAAAPDAETSALAARMATYDPIDFYGGTLDGIRERLPYLASLGVEVLYLNPVFEARSNHRYDTADYERIDPLLGTNDDFRLLCEEARAQGISIVLDAVLSHTGNDSRYFNAMGTYDAAGAMQGPDSPFYYWYDFSDAHGKAGYRSWWGFETLPEVDERDASWQRYILGDAASGQEGVLPNWLAAGVRGYRLDVADELPDDVLEHIRTCVKAADPEAVIIGEVWEDATTKASYGSNRTYALGRSLDSVMNYPLRDALLRFAMGAMDAYQLATFLKLQQANYPRPLYRCLMNLMSSHDVERLRSVLALGRPLRHSARDKQLQAVEGITRAQDARAARLQRMVVGLLYALPGAPCIYYGDERGLHGGSDPFCRATFPWDGAERVDCGEDLTTFYRNMGALRKGSDVLRQGGLACMATSADVLCVVRALEDDPEAEVVVAATNRGEQGQVVVLDLLSPELALPEPVRREVLARSAAAGAGMAGAGAGRSPFLSCEGGIVTFMVAPCSTRIFRWSAGLKR